MVFRPDRDRRGPDPTLDVRLALLGIGAVLALAGIFTDTRWLINAAIGVLIIGFVLRFVSKRRYRREAEAGTDEEVAGIVEDEHHVDEIEGSGDADASAERGADRPGDGASPRG